MACLPECVQASAINVYTSVIFPSAEFLSCVSCCSEWLRPSTSWTSVSLCWLLSFSLSSSSRARSWCSSSLLPTFCWSDQYLTWIQWNPSDQDTLKNGHLNTGHFALPNPVFVIRTLFYPHNMIVGGQCTTTLYVTRPTHNAWFHTLKCITPVHVPWALPLDWLWSLSLCSAAAACLY